MCLKLNIHANIKIRQQGILASLAYGNIDHHVGIVSFSRFKRGTTAFLDFSILETLIP